MGKRVLSEFHVTLAVRGKIESLWKRLNRLNHEDGDFHTLSVVESSHQIVLANATPGEGMNIIFGSCANLLLFLIDCDILPVYLIYLLPLIADFNPSVDFLIYDHV